MRPTNDQLRAFEGIALSWRWNVSFPKFPSIGSYPASEALNLRCSTVELPNTNIEYTEFEIRGVKVSYPAKGDIQNVLSLTFIETDDMVVNGIIDEWQKAIYDMKTGKISKKSDVQGIMLIELLNSEDEAVYKFEVIGCMYESSERGTGEEGGSEPFRPTINFRFDYFNAGKV